MLDLAFLARIGLTLGVAYLISLGIYNVFFHPLRKFPGDLLYRISHIPRSWHHMTGGLPFVVRDMHRRYGSVVRISPNSLAFCSPGAWQDIYGYRKAGQFEEHEIPKDPGFYKMYDNVPESLLNASFQKHAVLRRLLSHGFSDRSMREQEPIIGSYVDLLISGLRSQVEKSSSCQNLQKWYNWTTFDLVGDLSFGVTGGFGCLTKMETHPWVRVIASVITQQSKIQALCQFGLRKPVGWLSQLGILASAKHRAIVYEKVGQRLKSGKDRPDFLAVLIKNMDELGLSQGQLAMNAAMLIFAGSETTVSVLCGATYFLTLHPDVLKKVQDEVRSAFKSDDEITLTSVSDLSYMLACLNESLRCYPPVAGGLPRQVPRGGAIIDGQFVPEGTVVTIHQWAINYDERFWTEPEIFAPERWLGDPKYKNDRLDAMQPFSVGPRNCLGRTLAYAEMRLILAKLLYNFDISIDDDSRGWIQKQKAYELWDKPALNIHLKPVVTRKEQKEGM